MAEVGPRRVERGQGPGRVLVVVVVVVGVALAGWRLVGSGGGGRDGGVPDDALGEIRERTGADETGSTTSTTLVAHNANRAFARAALRLEEGGSFAFSGHVATNDPPGDGTPGRSVRGETLVATGSSRQTSDSGPSEPMIETVVVGPTVWERRAPTRDELADAPFAFAGDVEGPAEDRPLHGGAALLPRWLQRTTDRQYLGTRRPGGEQVFRAALATDELAPLGLEVLDHDADGRVRVDLWIDADGAPTRVEVGLHPTVLDLYISDIGAPTVIDPPAGKLPGVTAAITPEDVRAAGLAEPVELGRLRPGWMLADVELVVDRRPGAGCARLVLAYRTIDPAAGGTIELTVEPATCTGEIVDRSLVAGGFSGEPRLSPNAAGRLTDGRTVVAFESTLPMDATLALLETLQTYDPATRPTPL